MQRDLYLSNGFVEILISRNLGRPPSLLARGDLPKENATTTATERKRIMRRKHRVSPIYLYPRCSIQVGRSGWVKEEEKCKLQQHRRLFITGAHKKWRESQGEGLGEGMGEGEGGEGYFLLRHFRIGSRAVAP